MELMVSVYKTLFISQHHLIFLLFYVFIYCFLKTTKQKPLAKNPLVLQRKDGSLLQSWDLQQNTNVWVSWCLCSEAGPLSPTEEHHPFIGEVVGGDLVCPVALAHHST